MAILEPNYKPILGRFNIIQSQAASLLMYSGLPIIVNIIDSAVSINRWTLCLLDLESNINPSIVNCIMCRAL